jgi:hypothetical protein
VVSKRCLTGLWFCCLYLALMACSHVVPLPSPPTIELRLGTLSGPAGDAIREPLRQALTEAAGMEPGASDRVTVTGTAELNIQDVSGMDLVRRDVPTGMNAYRTVSDPFVNKDFIYYAPVVEPEVEEIPFVLRRAKLTLTYTLTESDGQSIEDPQVVESQLTRKYGGINEHSSLGPVLADLPGTDAALNELVRDLANRLIADLVPIGARVDLAFRRGKVAGEEKRVREGVFKARDGRWGEAAAIWTSVLAEDSEQPEANYNLGVFHERIATAEHLIKAREYYLTATKFGHDPLYRGALTRVTVRMSDKGIDYVADPYGTRQATKNISLTFTD